MGLILGVFSLFLQVVMLYYIAKQENANLSEFRNRESDIIQRFDKNIERFKYLRGVVDDPQTRLDEESLAQAVPE